MAYVIRGSALLKAGKSNQAIVDFRRVLELTGDPDWRRQIGDLLRELGEE